MCGMVKHTVLTLKYMIGNIKYFIAWSVLLVARYDKTARYDKNAFFMRKTTHPQTPSA